MFILEKKNRVSSFWQSTRVYFTLHTWVWCNFPAALQEWEEEVYPPYANGPGYVISSDIAEYIVSEFDNQKLRVSHHHHPLSVTKFWNICVVCLKPNKWVCFPLIVAVVQDGRCEHGHVGSEVQQDSPAGGVFARCQVLPGRLLRRLLHRTLPVPAAHDLPVEEAAVR